MNDEWLTPETAEERAVEKLNVINKITKRDAVELRTRAEAEAYLTLNQHARSLRSAAFFASVGISPDDAPDERETFYITNALIGGSHVLCCRPGKQ